MTDPFTASLHFDRWANQQPRRTVCLQEAFEVFREDLYGLMMDKIGTSQAPDASGRSYWTALLWRWKRWAENPDRLDVARAKDYPITELIGRYGIEVRRNMAKCPLHEDSTASMSFKYNRFNCFGCGAKGDTIELVMKMQKCSFIEAVKSIS